MIYTYIHSYIYIYGYYTVHLVGCVCVCACACAGLMIVGIIVVFQQGCFLFFTCVAHGNSGLGYTH